MTIRKVPGLEQSTTSTHILSEGDGIAITVFSDSVADHDGLVVSCQTRPIDFSAAGAFDEASRVLFSVVFRHSPIPLDIVVPRSPDPEFLIRSSSRE